MLGIAIGPTVGEPRTNFPLNATLRPESLNPYYHSTFLSPSSGQLEIALQPLFGEAPKLPEVVAQVNIY